MPRNRNCGRLQGVVGGIFAFLLFGAGCATTTQVPQSEAQFRLYVDATPKESVIVVDDEVMGSAKTTAEVPLSLTAGTRRVAITCAGYHTFRTTLEYIQPGETYTLKAHLIASEF